MTRDHSSKGNLAQQSPTPRTSAVGRVADGRGGRFTPGWEEVRRMFPQQEQDLRFQLGAKPTAGPAQSETGATARSSASSRALRGGSIPGGTASRDRSQRAALLELESDDQAIPPWVLEYARRTDAARSRVDLPVESEPAREPAPEEMTSGHQGDNGEQFDQSADFHEPVIQVRTEVPRSTIEWSESSLAQTTPSDPHDSDAAYFEKLESEYAQQAGLANDRFSATAETTTFYAAPLSERMQGVAAQGTPGQDISGQGHQIQSELPGFDSIGVEPVRRAGSVAPAGGIDSVAARSDSVAAGRDSVAAGRDSVAAGRDSVAAGLAEPADDTTATVLSAATLTSFPAVNEDGTPSPYGAELLSSLELLVRMIANVTEAYSAAIFLVEPSTPVAISQTGTTTSSPAVASASGAPAPSGLALGAPVSGMSNSGKGILPAKVLRLVAAQTLSRDVVQGARIGFGCGLVGWTAENGVRISVCPFEHDATTLLYYTRDQSLKSFIAVPIVGPDGAVLGVLSCDSKKSYAFAKVTEKILLDCAAQAAVLVGLHLRLGKKTNPAEVNEDLLTQTIERLRNQASERALLTAAAELPMEVVERDALVLITTGEGLSARAAFHSPSNQGAIGHRLLELVTRHKKVICGERSVQANSGDDSTHRSFLSIPFHVLRQEAGSLNLLSRPFEPFSATEIAALEKLAGVIGKELELFRLKEKALAATEEAGLLSYRRFNIRASAFLEEAKRARIGLSLVRIALTNIPEVESKFGVEAASDALLRVMRLVDQSKRSGSPACYLYGTHLVILTESAEAERMRSRVVRLIERLELETGPSATGVSAVPSTLSSSISGEPFGKLLARGLVISVANAPRDGETIEQLFAKTRQLFESDERHQSAVLSAPAVTGVERLQVNGEPATGNSAGASGTIGRARKAFDVFSRAGNW